MHNGSTGALSGGREPDESTAEPAEEPASRAGKRTSNGGGNGSGNGGNSSTPEPPQVLTVKISNL